MDPDEKTILVVDDEPAIRVLLANVFRPAGYHVLEAPDGRVAMAMLDAHPVDVLLIDLIMPEQEGMETIRAARKKHPQLKIIAMSGAFGIPYFRAAQLLGAHTAIQKPFVPEDVLAVIRRVLDGSEPG
jgi:DNA-binding NtrC family response regulator